MTPGAVIVTVPGSGDTTMARPLKKRPPLLLITTGLIGAVGLLSAGIAVIWRGIDQSVVTSPGASATPSAALSPSILPVASVSRSPPTAAEPSVSPIVSPGALASVNAPAEPSAPRTLVIPRQSTRHVPARPAEPATTGRPRPQDRLERDLGF
jgi:hypothetical protein